MIKTKSVWEPINRKKDGIRILATRYRGRGMPKTRYDIWMASLAPSEKLLRSFSSWGQFTRQYRKELRELGSIDKKNPLIKNHGQKWSLRLIQFLAKKGPVTLLCHCSWDQKKCHRHVLKRILNGKVT